MADEEFIPVVIPLNGKLILSEDPAVIGQNFQSLVNMRYGSVSPVGIGGMQKVNVVLISI